HRVTVGFQRVYDAQFRSRKHPRKDVVPLYPILQFILTQLHEFITADGFFVSVKTHLTGDRLSGRSIVTCNDLDLNTRFVERLEDIGNIFLGWIIEGDESEKGERQLLLLFWELVSCEMAHAHTEYSQSVLRQFAKRLP